MRKLALISLMFLGACAQLDTSPGASGVPDIPLGPAGFRQGSMSTSGTVTLNREVPPDRQFR